MSPEAEPDSIFLLELDAEESLVKKIYLLQKQPFFAESRQKILPLMLQSNFCGLRTCFSQQT